MTVYLPLHLIVYLPVHLIVRLPVHLSVFLSVHPTVRLSIYLIDCLSFYDSICLWTYQSSNWPSVSLSYYPPAYLSNCQSIRPTITIHQAIFLSVCQSNDNLSASVTIYLYVHLLVKIGLSICRSIWLSVSLSEYPSGSVWLLQTVCPSIYLSVDPCVNLRTCPSFSLPLSVFQSFCLSACLSIYPSIC